MPGLEPFDENLRLCHGARNLVGVDEAGRGPLAGPVLAAAVIMPRRFLPELAEARDSKLLSPRRRQALFGVIRKKALQVGVGWSSVSEIDEHNILRATLSAMRRALAQLDLGSDALVLVDGNQRVPGLCAQQQTLVDGDSRSFCVACASIVAKVLRDRWMSLLHRRYPGYGLDQNKGYGTAFHLRALSCLGPSPIHRRSFAPVSRNLTRTLIPTSNEFSRTTLR